MIDDLTITRQPAPDRSDGERRPLVWACFGLDEGWVETRLGPVLQRYGALLTRSAAPPETLAALEIGAGDWDILFLGQHPQQMLGAPPLEQILNCLNLDRPFDCVLGVLEDLTPEAHLSLMQAGAFDALDVQADIDQLISTIARLVEVASARQQRLDQTRMELLNKLAISVNHEINNPLTGLMGATELLLLEQRGLDEKGRHDLQTILAQCHRIQEVTARLKTLRHLRTIPYGSHDQMIDLTMASEQPHVPVARPEPASAPDGKALPTILVVDDNPLIIDLIARLFEDRFVIEAAGDASEALRKVVRKSYDLVLIDLILPEMNGLDLYRAIRRQRPRQKAMLTTAYEGDPRVEQAIAEGAKGCIYKPFQLEDLESALRDAVRAE